MEGKKHSNCGDGIEENLIVGDFLYCKLKIFIHIVKNKVHNETDDGKNNDDNSCKHASLCLTTVDRKVVRSSIVSMSLGIFQ